MAYSTLHGLMLACWACCVFVPATAIAAPGPKHKHQPARHHQKPLRDNLGVVHAPMASPVSHKHKSEKPFDIQAMYSQVKELQERSKKMASDIAKTLTKRKAEQELQLNEQASGLKTLEERNEHLSFLIGSLLHDNVKRRNELEELDRSRSLLMSHLRSAHSNMTRMERLLNVDASSSGDSNEDGALDVLEELDDADDAQHGDHVLNEGLQAVAKGKLTRERLALLQETPAQEPLAPVQDESLSWGTMSVLQSLKLSFVEMEAEANATTRVLDGAFESKHAIGLAKEKKLLEKKQILESYLAAQKELAEHLQSATSLLTSEQTILQRRSDGLQHFLLRLAARATKDADPTAAMKSGKNAQKWKEWMKSGKNAQKASAKKAPARPLFIRERSAAAAMKNGKNGQAAHQSTNAKKAPGLPMFTKNLALKNPSAATKGRQSAEFPAPGKHAKKAPVIPMMMKKAAKAVTTEFHKLTKSVKTTVQKPAATVKKQAMVLKNSHPVEDSANLFSKKGKHNITAVTNGTV